jgi:CubicO group peptidase (beta-lactamase class C family)
MFVKIDGLALRALVASLCVFLSVLVSASASAGERLTGADLAPAPVYDSGSGVPDPAGFFTTAHPAVSYRNVEEILPTRRVAAGPSASPLVREKPRDFRYQFGGASYGVADFAQRTDTTGLLVLKGNHVLFEGYYQGADAQDLFMSFSAGKSFVSTLVALALAEGKIHSLEDPIMRYLPELKGSAYETATIKQVLQMASGTSYSEEYEDTNSDIATFAAIVARSEGGLYDFARSFKSKEPPGTRFYYATTNTEVLGALINRVTGKPIAEYMSEKLWRPLGAEAPARWILDRPGAAGREMAGGGLQVRLRDYGRFGLLFAEGGRWNGKQLLPAGWVATATQPQDAYVQFGQLIAGYPLGYGYQWWCLPGPHQRFTAQGIHGQFILVDPMEHVVVVKLSSWQHAWEDAKEAETYAFFDAVTAALQGES